MERGSASDGLGAATGEDSERMWYIGHWVGGVSIICGDGEEGESIFLSFMWFRDWNAFFGCVGGCELGASDIVCNSWFLPRRIVYMSCVLRVLSLHPLVSPPLPARWVAREIRSPQCWLDLYVFLTHTHTHLYPYHIFDAQVF